MAYVAVKGGEQAIEESLRRLKYERVKGAKRSVDWIELGHAAFGGSGDE